MIRQEDTDYCPLPEVGRKRFVVCFVFGENNQVLLVKKNPRRPELAWMRDLWNGVGGVVEESELPLAAMVREFEEETGMLIPAKDWDHFCTELGSEYALYCFRATLKSTFAFPQANDAGETLRWKPVVTVVNAKNVLGNLHWMVPLAQDWRKLYVPVEVHFESNISERPSW